ncbi:LOW QUALITY PROTEIN: hypothetical protein Cgig2_015851 [Carnegiea gigantea]|uniref:Uncharacterized protein n=1 Tax=Carnegiea gigantea TaxID=171969 RepID=A0A9Q1GU10_9CARY|nr:LOW QUALITY PROTEIN: hypothetical protein Cgig2_015851 [Carnegiea gigantea]
MRCTPNEPRGLRSRRKPRELEEKFQNGERPLSVAPTENAPTVPLETGAVSGASHAEKAPPMTSALKPHSTRKYCEFHEQHRHTTVECRELRKALHELVNKGQIDCFLKKGPHFLQKKRKPARPDPRDKECSNELVATITGGYVEGLHLESLALRSPVLMAEQGSRVIIPKMVFGGGEDTLFTSLQNDPLVVKMKVASAIARRILIDTASSVDIITWDCLKKLKYLRREIIPLVHPVLGFRGQEVNPTGMIRLPLRFGDKTKAKNLEVDFLVVDVPTTYNIILERPTLHKARKKKKRIKSNWGSYTSNVWILIIITVSMCLVLMTFTIRSHSPTIKGRGLLVTQVIFVSCWWDEIHQLRVLSLSWGLTTILYVLNVCLKVALLVGSIKGQDHQEFPKELRTVLMAPAVALLLSLGHFLNSCHGLGLALERASSRRHYRSPFSASKASFSIFTFSRRRLYLAVDSPDF